MKKYDYLIVGSGLYGATFAYLAKQRGKRCLVLERRPHLGGNLYCEEVEGIHIHTYGAHIFHTSNREVWELVNSLVEMNRYTNSPVANYQGELYNLPFNMNTFYQMWGVKTPAQAKAKIEEQKQQAVAAMQAAGSSEPRNLEEQALSLIGTDIYEKLIKGYTEKQWGRKCSELPAFIIKRLPVRFTFDNNYFNDTYQGIPIGGYNQLIDKLLEGTECRVNCDYLEERDAYDGVAKEVVYTGAIDAYYNYCFGKLEYRTVTFETELIRNCDNYQGNAVVNYTEREVPYTRIIEHKHFEFGTQPHTVISREYPSEWSAGSEPFYPVNDAKNSRLYQQYKELAEQQEGVTFGGRLGTYAYYDMAPIIEQVLNIWKNRRG
ncbi:MAG: UDP-galactopyranose mutase [Phocaeicola sp.]